MYIAILGRQPSLGMAELESRFGSDETSWFSSQTATIDTEALSITQLGGTLKAGRISAEYPSGSWQKISHEVISTYIHKWASHEGKITLGISVYGFPVSGRDVQKIGITIKQKLKKSGVSLRLIPNTEAHLNTATSHHNKLGLSPNKVELLIVRNESGKIIVAESTGAQNITALAARDQARPKRDAFVGMLPPKLALIMINLAARSVTRTDSETSAQARGSDKRASLRSEDCLSEASSTATKEASASNPRRAETVSENVRGNTGPILLDPFCGTGVILQEAALLGYNIYGTDLSEKMVDYTAANLAWLKTTHRLSFNETISHGDAMTTTWQQPIDLVVSETYLGQPFSAPPSPKKLEEVRGNVNHITTTFLKNIRPQLTAGTPLCLAVPAWRDAAGHITHLPFIRSVEQLGFKQVVFTNVKPHDLIYYREDQVVARELLVLVRA